MTERLFGTDGVRAKAGEGVLSFAGATGLGNAIGIWLKNRNPKASRVIIGMDTRKSGPMLKEALSFGIGKSGVHVVSAGILPTPAVAYLTRKEKFDLGIAISASHNPWEYNGVKCFDGDGFKLSDTAEDEIEVALRKVSANGCNCSAPPKRCAPKEVHLCKDYLSYLIDIAGGRRLRGIKLVVDCANGATFHIAPKLFKALGASLFVINASANGADINDRCGSLYPQRMREAVISNKADLGVAFDGDGDRIIACDERANVLDGDYLMAAFARDMIKNNTLAKNTLVATQMSNVMLEQAMEDAAARDVKDGRVIRVGVGDKFVLQRLRRDNLNFGGEQAGHIIFLDHSTTGDGLLSAIMLLGLIAREDKPASEIFSPFKKFPQVLVNVRIKERKPFEDMPALSRSIQKCKATLGRSGRVFVRYSGTEPLARVMVEGPDEAVIKEMAESIASHF